MVNSNFFSSLISSIKTRIIGQEELIESLIICMISNGHALIEGFPGLAKTVTAKTLADGVEADFHRIQFTPDLLPSDLIGTDIYVQDKNKF